MDQVMALWLAAHRAGWRLATRLRAVSDYYADDKALRQAYDAAADFRQHVERYWAGKGGAVPYGEDKVQELVGDRLSAMLTGHSPHVMEKAVRLVAGGHVTITLSTADVLEGWVVGDTDRYRCATDPAGHSCTCPAGAAHRFCSHLLAMTLHEAAVRLAILDPAHG